MSDVPIWPFPRDFFVLGARKYAVSACLKKESDCFLHGPKFLAPSLCSYLPGRVCRCCSAAHQTRVTDGSTIDSSQTLTRSLQICMLRMPRACPFLRMFPYLFLSLHVWTLVDKACARPDFDRCVCSRHVCCHK